MGLNLQSTITLNSSSFERGMQNTVKGVADGVKQFAIAAIGIYSIERALSATIETAKELVNESKRMGITIEYLQVLRKAAADAGVEADRLAEAYAKVSEFRAKALGSGKDTVMVMRMTNLLGMNRSDVLNSSTEDIFKKIGEKLKTTNPQEITQALKDVFGKAFGPIIPILTRDMDALQKQMESLGMIISSKVATQLYQFSVQMSAIKNIFISALAPVLVQVVEMFLGLLTSGGLVSQAFEGLVFKLQELGLFTQKDANGLTLSNRSKMEGDMREQFFKNVKDAQTDKTYQNIIRRENNLEPGDKIPQSMINNAAAEATVAKFRGGTPDQQSMVKDFKGQYGDKDFAKQFSAFLGNIQGQMTGAITGASKSSKGVIDGIQTWLDKFKNGDIAAPPKPDFANLEGLQSTLKTRVANDSLVKVGNFLGSSNPAVNNVQNLIAKATQSTADNTKKIADHLDNKSNHPPLPRGSNFQGTMWPAN